jgi:hypothetical protein
MGPSQVELLVAHSESLQAQLKKDMEDFGKSLNKNIEQTLIP